LVDSTPSAAIAAHTESSFGISHSCIVHVPMSCVSSGLEHDASIIAVAAVIILTIFICMSLF
jgi:hypothetical protein